MEHINYNGVGGVFIPNKEFEEIKKVIAKQKELTTELIIKGVAPASAIDELMGVKYSFDE